MEKDLSMKEWVKDILIAILIAVAVMQFIKPTVVKESSMEPNFNENDYLFVSRQSYRLFGNDPERGDVIVFNSGMKTESGADKLLIKRVIAIPGDEISVIDGEVYVNGIVNDDSYTKDQTTNGHIQDLMVPDGTYFCMGDNRLVSIDSRSPRVGFVPEESIVGKVVFRLFPLSDIGTIHNPYNEE